MATTNSETETARSNSDRKFVAFGRKILELVKLMALTIYAKAGLLKPSQGLCLKANAKTKDLQSQGQGQGHKFWP